jgi:hypothetical protein
MIDPNMDREKGGEDNVSSVRPVDQSTGGVEQSSFGPHSFQTAAEGTDIVQTVNYNIYNASGADRESVRSILKFVKWQRKDSNPVKLGPEFERKIERVRDRFARDRLIVIETHLASFAEDAFHVISTWSEYSGGKLEAVRSLEAPDDDSSFGTILSDISRIEFSSIFFLDTRAFREQLRNELQSELESSDAYQLIHALKLANTFCVVFAPATRVNQNAFVSPTVTFSYEEERRILVDRASDGEEGLAGFIEDQINRFMWAGEHLEQLRVLDESIRSGKVRQQALELHNRLAQVVRDSSEYAVRLNRLLGNERTEASEAENLSSLHEGWSRQVTCALIEHALFFMSHFEGLTPTEFDLLMKTFLQRKTAKEFRSAPAFKPDGPVPMVEEVNDVRPQDTISIGGMVSLLDAYNGAPDRVLRLIDVHLHENRRLAFAPALKQQVARELLRSTRVLWVDGMLFEETIDRAVLFDLPLSIAGQLAERHAEHAISLSLGGQKEGADDFVLEWMERTAQQFVIRRILRGSSGNEVGAARPIKILCEALDRSASRDRAKDLLREYTDRVSLFFFRLLSNATTRPQVDQALHWLLMEGQGSDARYSVILMFVRILRRHPDFRALFWLKRLLSEGDEDAKRSALDFLARGIEHGRSTSAGEGLSFLDALRTWLPTDVSRVPQLNSQTAALLAPRIAIYRAFASIRDQNHGKVEQLAPLFDLNREDGISRDLETAIELLTAPIDGPWIRDDLGLLNQLAVARWQLDGDWRFAGDSSYPFTPSVLTGLPALRGFSGRRAGDPWTEGDSRHMALVGMLTEAITVLLGSPEAQDQRRLAIADTLIRKVAMKLSRLREDGEAIRSASERADAFERGLKQNRSNAAQRRARCVRLIGNVFYRLYKEQRATYQ